MGGTGVGRLDRRTFLGGAAAGALALGLGRWTGIAGASAGKGEPFSLGVASGDPLHDRVILWTRLAPDPLRGGGLDEDDVEVEWEVATDDGFTDVVASGTATAEGRWAHSVHVDADGLEPDSWYWYRFRALGATSPAGRTRTAPARGCTADRVRFGFASCQDWQDGYWGAHRHLALEDLDLLVFLGDYIYESGPSDEGVRPHNSDEVFTLDEYRNRYALYKGDPGLQACHAARPWLVIWDDHEVDNNHAGDVHEDGDPRAEFLERRAAAYQAWWEHQPVRLPPPEGPDYEVYRTLHWGGLADFVLLDGRQYRDDQLCGGELAEPCAGLDDPERTMLGSAQEAWVADELLGSEATWKVIANQTVLTRLLFGSALNMDQWDGYPAAQQRMVDLLGRVDNPLVITGDIHAAGIAQLRTNYDDPATTVGVELVGTSISSSFPTDLAAAAESLISGLDWIEYANARNRGYAVVDLDGTRMEATYRVVDDALDPDTGIRTDTTYAYPASGLGLRCAPDLPAEPPPAAPPASPAPGVPTYTG